MFVRKKTKIRIAYGFLAATSIAIIANDARLRTVSLATMHSPRIAAPAPALAITRLADSPFPEARPNRMDANATALGHSESRPTLKPGKIAAPSSVYFLTVPVQVNSNDGPVALIRGTRLQFVRQQDGKFLVRHNRTDFLIEKSQVTDDLSALTALAHHSS